MKRVLLALAIATPTLSNPAIAEEAFTEFRSLKPEVALEMAQTALQACRDGGFQVGVTVTDRLGVPQVFLRDQFAGPHVFETSRRKAWTAVSFKSSTLELDEATRPGSSAAAIRDLNEALPLGGGVPVNDGDGSLVAGIGISGAPSPQADHDCALVGIEAIEDMISF